MSRAAVLVMHHDPDSHGVFLDRWASDGDVAGDTWHETMEDAKYPSEFDYGEAKGPWIPIPDDIDDTREYALSQLRGY